jgi:hypothetical protein
MNKTRRLVNRNIQYRPSMVFQALPGNYFFQRGGLLRTTLMHRAFTFLSRTSLNLTPLTEQGCLCETDYGGQMVHAINFDPGLNERRHD